MKQRQSKHKGWMAERDKRLANHQPGKPLLTPEAKERRRQYLLDHHDRLHQLEYGEYEK